VVGAGEVVSHLLIPTSSKKEHPQSRDSQKSGVPCERLQSKPVTLQSADLKKNTMLSISMYGWVGVTIGGVFSDIPVSYS
jgi:hypothetical protein